MSSRSDSATCATPMQPAAAPPTSVSLNARRPKRLAPVGTRRFASQGSADSTLSGDLAPSSEQSCRPARNPEELRARFKGLNPTSFHPDGVAFFAMSDMEAPVGFEAVWHSFRPQHRSENFSEVEKQALSTVAGVIIVSDTKDLDQIADAATLSKHIRSLIDDHQPTILLPHSTVAVVQPLRLDDGDLEALIHARNLRFDHVLVGEPACFRLAIEVRSALRHYASKGARYQTHVQNRMTHAKRYEELKRVGHSIVWQYFRCNLGSRLPCIDGSIGNVEKGSMFCGLRLGEFLGHGAYGSVYRMVNPIDSKPVDEVLKVVRKKEIASFEGIWKTQNEIEIMTLLSSPSLEHPNLNKLLDVYHSNDHVFFRLRYAGPMNLLKRLQARDEQRQPLSESSAARIMAQLLDALCHLHMVAKVVHKDIKPENIIVSEDSQGSIATLTDFDLASSMPDDALCRGIAGTFPFMAPELGRRAWYKPYPADIWSMGVVCLEILCSAYVFEKAFNSTSLLKKNRWKSALMEAVTSCFKPKGSIDDFLCKHVHPELGLLRQGASVLLGGMLTVPVLFRWEAERLHEEMRADGTFTRSETSGM